MATAVDGEGERTEGKRQRETVIESETKSKVDRRGDRGHWTRAKMRRLRKEKYIAGNGESQDCQDYKKVRKRKNMKEKVKLRMHACQK